MIRGSEYMASFPVLRAPVIETNIEDFLFSRSTKQRYPECSFSQFWQYLVFRVSVMPIFLRIYGHYCTTSNSFSKTFRFWFRFIVFVLLLGFFSLPLISVHVFNIFH